MIFLLYGLTNKRINKWINNAINNAINKAIDKTVLQTELCRLQYQEFFNNTVL